MANSKSIGCGGAVVFLIGLAIISSWFSGGDTDVSPESISESQSSETFQSFGCLEVSETLVDSIGYGFD